MFARLSPGETAELSRLLVPHQIKAHDTIFWIGESGTEFYVIESGEIELSYPDESGKEVTLATLSRGQFFGELSLLDGGIRTATARAATEVVVLSLARQPFLDFLERNPTAAVHALQVLGLRQREMLSKLRSVRNVNEVVRQEHTSAWQMVADFIATVSAHKYFFMFHIVWFSSWVIYNAIRGDKGFDPPPFGLLTLIVSLEAIFLSIFVLISQNRSGEIDRVRADLDYQVNVKAHLEVMLLHQKIDRIEKLLGERLDADQPVKSDLPQT